MEFEKFKQLLDEQVSWPDYYTFKFITKTDSKHHVINILEDHQIMERPSKNGKYTSISSRKIFNSADEIVEVYESVSKIEGVINL